MRAHAPLPARTHTRAFTLAHTHTPARTRTRAAAALAIAVLALVAACLCAMPRAAYAASVDSSQPGVIKQGDKYYYITPSGNKKTGTFKAGGWTYYADSKGVIEARKKGSAYYYNNGVRMTAADTKDYKAYTAAKKWVKKLTKKSDSKATKRYKCFRWLMKQPTVIHRHWSYQREAWPAVYAMDHFKRIGGDCQSYAAAFAYMAAAIGYKNTYACTDTKTEPGGGHSWAMIGKAVYDPMFASRSFSTFYNSTHGTYQINPTTRVLLPMFNPKHAKGSAKSSSSTAKSHKTKLVKKKGKLKYYVNGKLVKNRWVSIGSKTYYFGGNGVAAVGSKKIKFAGKKAYYVFSSKGVLQTGKKTRDVRVDGVRYRVSKSGKAKPGKVKEAKGWRYYQENGAAASGLCFYKGKLSWFDKKTGYYNSDKTKKVRKAAKADADITPLLKIAGKGTVTKYPDSCLCLPDQTGTDVQHSYALVDIQTFVDDETGAELFVYASPKK